MRETPYEGILAADCRSSRTSACRLPAAELRAAGLALRPAAPVSGAWARSGLTSGRRRVASQRPIRLRIIFAGPGFDSQKLASKSRAYLRSISRASGHSLRSAARTMRASSAGASLEATLTRPLAPMPMAASARLSSPEKILKPRGTECTNSATCGRLPLDSLIPAILDASSASRDDGIRFQIHTRTAGDVVEHYRQRVNSFRQSQKVLVLPLLRGFVVIGICGEHGIHAANLRQFFPPASPACASSCACIRPTLEPGQPRPPQPAGQQSAILFRPVLRPRRSSRKPPEVDTGINLPVHQCAERPVVDEAVPEKRG